MKQLDEYLLSLQRAARSHVLAINPTLEEDKQREWLHNVYIHRVTCADFLRKAGQAQDSSPKHFRNPSLFRDRNFAAGLKP